MFDFQEILLKKSNLKKMNKNAIKANKEIRLSSLITIINVAINLLSENRPFYLTNEIEVFKHMQYNWSDLFNSVRPYQWSTLYCQNILIKLILVNISPLNKCNDV